MSVVKTSKLIHPDAASGGILLTPTGGVSFDGEDASEFATQAYVDSEVAGAVSGLASETFVNEKIEEASPIGLILALGG